jgi:hypothetical protein
MLLNGISYQQQRHPRMVYSAMLRSAGVEGWKVPAFIDLTATGLRRMVWTAVATGCDGTPFLHTSTDVEIARRYMRNEHLLGDRAPKGQGQPWLAQIDLEGFVEGVHFIDLSTDKGRKYWLQEDSSLSEMSWDRYHELDAFRSDANIFATRDSEVLILTDVESWRIAVLDQPLVQPPICGPWATIPLDGFGAALSTDSRRQGFPLRWSEILAPFLPADLRYSRPPIGRFCLLDDFNGRVWGDEYLCLRRGDIVDGRVPPEGVETAGWFYGHVVGAAKTGWFPPSFVCCACAKLPGFPTCFGPLLRKITSEVELAP